MCSTCSQAYAKAGSPVMLPASLVALLPAGERAAARATHASRPRTRQRL
jgi:hypothetical protein